MKHVVMFSSGAGSWAAAKRVANAHGTSELYLVFADVSGEDEDNYRFLKEASQNVGGTLIWLKDGRTIWQVFRDERFLGNSRLAICSKLLKQKPCRKWLDENCDPSATIVYVGIDWTEGHRLAAVERAYLPYRVEAPMLAPPYLTKRDILKYIRNEGIEPPRLYAMGFAHANCGGGCVRSGKAQFAHLLRVLPERFAEWEKNEEDLRGYLGNVSICRRTAGGEFDLLTLRALREEVESGTYQNEFDFGGCGCFTDDVREGEKNG